MKHQLYEWYVVLECLICERKNGVVISGGRGEHKIVGCASCGSNMPLVLEEDRTLSYHTLRVEMGLYK